MATNTAHLAVMQDAYIALLRLPLDHPVRMTSQNVLAGLANAIALETGMDIEMVQNLHEALANAMGSGFRFA